MDIANFHTEEVNGSGDLPTFDLFRNFDKITLKQILSTGHYHSLEDEEQLFNGGRSNNDAYLVLDGMLYAYSKSDVMVMFKKGDCINAGFLHNPKLACPEIKASGHVKILCYKRSEILNFFRENPEKVFKLFTMNVIQCQQKLISDLFNKPSLNQQNL